MDPLGQHLLIVCKAAGLKWETTESLFGLRGTISAQQLQQMHCNFMKLQTKTAKMAIEFYRLRENAASVAVS
jgi:hypothetical protein